MAEALPRTGAGKRVCVTGASGFLGSHIVKQLLQRGYTVRGTVRDATNDAKYGWLNTLAEGTPGTLELFSADLLVPGSFDKAVEGCQYVCHTAAVVKFTGFKDPQREVVDPAVEGTRNVLNAVLKAQTAKKVVYTSATVAAVQDPPEHGRTYTDEDWLQQNRLHIKFPYDMGKTLAERLAWGVYEEHKAKAKGGWSFDLVSVLPGLTVGDLLHAQHSKSSGAQFVVQLMDGTMAMAPDFYFSFVHVRDVAKAHILVMESEKSQGRYMVSESNTRSVLEIGKMVKREFPHCRIPSMVMPSSMLYAFSMVSTMICKDRVKQLAGVQFFYSSKKYMSEFGVDLIPSDDALIETARSLMEHGVLSKPGPTASRSITSLYSWRRENVVRA